MRTKLIIATLFIIFACALQSWLASMSIFIDLILATTIVFAFFFDIWELIIFVLFSLFVINWQPAFSVELVFFALILLIVHGVYKFFGLIPWVAVPIAIVLGFFVLDLAVAPCVFFSNSVPFLMDMFGGLLFGELVYAVLGRNMP